MNKLKRTLALVATLAISATAFVGCGDDDSSSPAASNSDSGSAADSNSDSVADDSTPADDANDPAPAGGEIKLATGGDKMTILTWTSDDLKVMVPTWEQAEGIDESKVAIKDFGCPGGDASAQYDQYFLGGEDVDMLLVEADWALKYVNDDAITAPLSDLGFTDADFADQYAYTMDIGKSTTSGAIKATSWQAAPGGWCYRTDLAEQYLSVKSPEEMQAKVSDWDAFQATAKEVSEASGGKTALTVTLGGIWQAFAANRTQPWVEGDKLVVDDSCNTFIELAKNMRDNKYVTEIEQWGDAWKPAGQTDDTMGYFVSTWGFGSFLLEAAGGEGGKTYGKWNVCQGPAPYYWGGTWLCVHPKTDTADMVASFMRYFTVNKDTMKQYALDKPDYVNNKTAMEEIVNEKSNSNPLLGGQDQFAVLHENGKNINLNGLITPYDASIKSEFLKAVDEYCKGNTADAAACIEDFKDRVAQSVTDITVD